jgi:hypothetical protein
MNKYPITRNNKNKEETIIGTILNNKNYPQDIIQQKEKSLKKNNKQKGKWATFTFFGPETRTMAKLFKITEIIIPYRTKTMLEQSG